MSERPLPGRSDSSFYTGTLPEEMVHAAAQELCRQEHGDWRYDPGKPKHRRFYDHAERALRVALQNFGVEHTMGLDGVGSSPPSAGDRSSSMWVRLIGPWMRVRLTQPPSPTSGLS